MEVQEQKRLINKYIGNRTFVNRGYYYFKDGDISIKEIKSAGTGNMIQFSSVAYGSEAYKQLLTYDEHAGEFTTMFCSCPAYAQYGPCKHLAAAMFQLEEDEDILTEMVQTKVERLRDEIEVEPAKLRAFLQVLLIDFGDDTYRLKLYVQPSDDVTNKVTEGYFVDKPFNFLRAYHRELNRSRYTLEKLNSHMLLHVASTVLSTFDLHLMEYLSAHRIDFYGKHSDNSFFSKETGNFEQLLYILDYVRMSGIPMYYTVPDTAVQRFDELDVVTVEELAAKELTVDGQWVLKQDEAEFEFYFEQAGNSEAQRKLIDFNTDTNQLTYLQFDETVAEYIGVYEKYRMDVNNQVIQEWLEMDEYLGYPVKHDVAPNLCVETIKPVYEIFITQTHYNKTVLEANIRYGENRYDPLTGRMYGPPKLIRVDGQDFEKFQSFFFRTVGEYVEYAPHHFAEIQSKDAYFLFLNEAVPLLLEEAEDEWDVSILLDEHLKRLTLLPLQFSMTATTTPTESVIDLQLEKNEELSVSDIELILYRYKLKQRFIELDNGFVIDMLDEQNQKRLEEMEAFQDALVHFREKNSAHIPRFQIFNYSEKSRGRTALKINKEIKQMIREVKTLKPRPLGLPDTLKTVLREYQLIGVYWMQQLAKYQFGGILADEMGLGKTLQVIAYLATVEEAEAPSLIIAPKTLMYNWLSEFQKFAPWLTVKVIDGTPKQRQATIQSLEAGEIGITSYPLVVKDFENYEQTLETLILDEAQYIKNPATKMAKVVKAFPSKQRFALTGTPMENNLMEVWSIFDFLMEGFLKSQKDFKRTIFNPVYKNEGKDILKDFKQTITPFVLRREKKVVLKELPDKIETPLYCEMEKKQRKLYQFYLAQAQDEVRDELMGESFATTGKIKILAIITRLRQVCTHPGMFLDNYDGQSAKLEVLPTLSVKKITKAINSYSKRVNRFFYFK